MRSERWSTDREIEKVLKPGTAGPILQFKNGECLSYEGEGHTMILGVSGSGKTRRGTIPMIKSVIRNKESAIIVDPKGEIHRNTKDEIPDCYDIRVIDLKNIYKEDAKGWNPLKAPYELWTSGSKKNRHMAEQMVEEMADAWYPVPPHDNPYWIEEARNVFSALVYALFILGKPEEINLVSLYYMIAKGEERFGIATYLKTLVEMLKDHENVAMLLLSYVTTASDTKSGIRSTFLNGLSTATRSESVRDFLSHDDLGINHLTGDKPTLIYIIIPDETPIYEKLTGILTGQLIKHYERLAEQEYAGKLPIRVNVVLEELGNIGRAIPNLPQLLTAGRSRNIRVAFVLQSMSQLTDVYGESNATTIKDNCDVRVVYRVNNWNTLTEISGICGLKEVEREGHMVREPLITQSQLAAMVTGQALVMIAGRVKFVTWLPDFTEMYPQIVKTEIRNKQEKNTEERTGKKAGYFDIQKYVKERKRQEIEEKLETDAKRIGMGAGILQSEIPVTPGLDMKSFFEEIDAKIAEKMAKEEREKAEEENAGMETEDQ